MEKIKTRSPVSRRAVMAGAAAFGAASATRVSVRSAWGQGKKEIVIGGTLPLTGPFAAFGSYWVDAYKFWEDEVNSKGGLLGSKVRLVTYDDRSDSSTSVSLYTKLITVDKADLLVGTFGPPVFAIMPIAEKYQMLLVQGGSSATGVINRGNYKYTVTALTTDLLWSDPLWDWLASVPADKRPKRLGFVQQVNPFQQGIVIAAVPKAKAVGIEVATTETFAADTQDLTSILLKLKAANIDMLFGAINYPPGLATMRTLAEMQFRPSLVYIATGPTVPEWVKDLGPRTDNVLTSTPYWRTLQGGGNEEFAKAIQARFGYAPPRDSGQAYTPLQILQQAVEGAKTLNQEELRKYIGTHEFSTVSGPMRFDDRGYTTAKNYLMQVQKGQQLLVYPASVKSADPIYPAG